MTSLVKGWRRYFYSAERLPHELCHALLDFDNQNRAALIRPNSESKLQPNTESELQQDIEKRANAFATYFLCPKKMLLEHVAQFKDPRATAEHIMSTYGIPYATVQLYLNHTAGLEIPTKPDSPINIEPWYDQESERGVDDFPLPEVPVDYRTAFARTATELFLYGQISRKQLAQILCVSDSSVLEVPRSLFGAGNPAVLFSELRDILVTHDVELEL